MKNEDAKTVGMVVVTTDKGLCGGLNTNLLRAATAKLKEVEAAGLARSEVVAIGGKGLGFMNRVGAKVVAHATQLGDQRRHRGPDRPGQGACWTRTLQASCPPSTCCYTQFINTMKQEVKVHQLLPLKAADMATADGKAGAGHSWDYIYEPDAATVHRRAARALHRKPWFTRPSPRTWPASRPPAWWP